MTARYAPEVRSGVGIACVVALSLAFFGWCAQGAIAATSADDVAKKIKELQDTINSFTGNPSDLSGNIKSLRTFLLVQKLGAPTDLDSVLKDVNSLNTNISGMGDADRNSDALYTALATLRGTIAEKVDVNWPVRTADAFKNALDKYIKGTTSPTDNEIVQGRMYDIAGLVDPVLRKQSTRAFELYSGYAVQIVGADLIGIQHSTTAAKASADLALALDRVNNPAALDAVVKEVNLLNTNVGALSDVDRNSDVLYTALATLRGTVADKVDVNWPVRTATAIKDALEKYVGSKSTPSPTDNETVQERMYDIANDLDPVLRKQGARAFELYSKYAGQVIASDPIHIQRSKTAVSAGADLALKLDTINDSADAAIRFTKLLDSVTALLGDGANQISLAQKMGDATNSDFKKSRDSFESAYAKVSQLKIHVLDSVFGDLRTRRGEGRLCSSLATMRQQCEGKADCTLPLPQSTQTNKAFDPLAPCGYDPAPLADAQFKGVRVDFVCLRPGLTTDAVMQNPGINPVTGKPWDKDDIFSPVLRSSSMSIRCPYPAQ